MNKNQQIDLDDLIQRHYGNQRLDEDVVDSILHRATVEEGNKPVLPREVEERRDWTRRQWLHAAVIGAVFLCGGAFVHRLVSQRDTRKILLNELVLHHREALELDAVTDSLEGLQVALEKLPFELRTPEHLVANHELLGGRYCSLLGKLAVQLKLRDPATGRIDTLFLTPQTAKLGELRAERIQVEETQITLGSTDDLFFGYARQIP